MGVLEFAGAIMKMALTPTMMIMTESTVITSVPCTSQLIAKSKTGIIFNSDNQKGTMFIRLFLLIYLV